MSIIPVFDCDGFLSLDDTGGNLATKKMYDSADRTDAIFNQLKPGQEIELVDGFFALNETLDLIRVHRSWENFLIPRIRSQDYQPKQQASG